MTRKEYLGQAIRLSVVRTRSGKYRFNGKTYRSKWLALLAVDSPWL